jgi:ubiquinone/menaquinone biosynthesis C-methylase UbiE
MTPTDPFDPGAVRRTYETVAEEYAITFGDDLARLLFDRRFLDDFARRVGQDGPVVDVGAGPGQVSAYLADRDIDVIATDLAPRMLDVARRRLVGAPLLAADLRHLPMRAHSCAGVAAWYVLPFVRRHELRTALTELRRVLRSGGVIALATHLGTGEILGSDQWLGQHVEPIGVTLYEEAEVTDALEDSCFRVEEVHQRAPLAHEHQGLRTYLMAIATD